MVPWADLGSVLGVGLLLGAGVVALYAVGVRALTPAAGSGRPGAGTTAVAVACFALCAVAVAYALYTLL
jgi:hypothetical protein